MLATPVIIRELVTAARNPNTYRTRLAAGAIATLMLALFLLRTGPTTTAGAELFDVIHTSVLLVLFVGGPLMTADSLSREKREGTLDLLYLTSLSAYRIVEAKFTASFLRLFSVWLVFVPLATVPFLIGGLTPKVVLSALAVQLGLMIISLTTGLLASALSKRMFPALALAFCLSGVFVWAEKTALYGLIEQRYPKVLNMGGNVFIAGNTLVVGGNAAHPWSLAALKIFSPAEITLNILFLVLLGFLLLHLAAACLKQEGNPRTSRIGAWFRETFLKPRYWQNTFRRTMNRRMDRNPLIWLEYRTAWSRVGRTVLVGALILAESLTLIGASRISEVSQLHMMAAIILMVIIAVTSATSFQKEKESGAFELLLVAPLTEWSLLGGRLRAVWSYYLPATATLAILMMLTVSFGFDMHEWMGSNLFNNESEFELLNAKLGSLACSAVTIPIVGLYFALRMKNLIPALMATLAVGLLIPLYFGQYLGVLLVFLSEMLPSMPLTDLLVHQFRFGTFPFFKATVLLHLAVAVFFIYRTYRQLQRRQFA